MSRVGKNPVVVPSGVNVVFQGKSVEVQGNLGKLSFGFGDLVSVEKAEGFLIVKPKSESKRALTQWGTARSLINNLVKGVSEGFAKNLEISGVGYKAAVQGKDLVLNLGFSHEVRYPIPEGVSIKCDKPTTIQISGIDKQKVGQVASEIRNFRRPEPYKGKGIMYVGERIVRKEGKKK